MAALSSYSKNRALELLLKDTPNLYVALFTSADGLVTNAPTAEVSTAGTGYGRCSVLFSASASGGVISNPDSVSTLPATVSWGTVTHWAIMDAASGGNVLIWAVLNNPRLISAGNVIIWRDGDINILAN